MGSGEEYNMIICNLAVTTAHTHIQTDAGTLSFIHPHVLYSWLSLRKWFETAGVRCGFVSEIRTWFDVIVVVRNMQWKWHRNYNNPEFFCVCVVHCKISHAVMVERIVLTFYEISCTHFRLDEKMETTVMSVLWVRGRQQPPSLKSARLSAATLGWLHNWVNPHWLPC